MAETCISEDPAQDGLNWYGYCGNNLLGFTDPTGLEEWALSRWAKATAYDLFAAAFGNYQLAGQAQYEQNQSTPGALFEVGKTAVATVAVGASIPALPGLAIGFGSAAGSAGTAGWSLLGPSITGLFSTSGHLGNSITGATVGAVGQAGSNYFGALVNNGWNYGAALQSTFGTPQGWVSIGIGGIFGALSGFGATLTAPVVGGAYQTGAQIMGNYGKSALSNGIWCGLANGANSSSQQSLSGKSFSAADFGVSMALGFGAGIVGAGVQVGIGFATRGTVFSNTGR